MDCAVNPIMPPPDHSPAPLDGESSRWTTRLQRLGRGALSIALFGVFVLWLPELFVDPAIRQGWKLKVLMGLIPLAVLGAAALLLAWIGEWQRRRKRRDGGPDRI